MYSVLMSVYKKEKPDYLKISIESMLDQTVQPDEIIIVKDGELTEELNQMISDYQKRYTKIFTVVALSENVGLGSALNAGLDKSRNELVARMDTDDISVPKRCEIQLAAFGKDPELDIVGSNIDEFIDDPENIVSSRKLPSDHADIVKFSKRRNPFNHPTIMYKKSTVLKHGGYKSYRRNQDYDLFVRMLHKGAKAKNIDKSLLLFRADRGNLARRKSWIKTSSNIKMLYDFYKMGHSGFFDFLIASLSHLAAFLMPSGVFKKISDRFLRN